MESFQFTLLILRFRLLTLVAVSSAVPHHMYPAYPLGYGYGYPLARNAPIQQEYPMDEATARFLVNFGSFQRVTGVFKTTTATTTVPAQTVTGNAYFYQNPFTGVNSKYKVDIRNLSGGTKYVLMLQTDCLKATTTGNVVSIIPKSANS